MPDSIKTITSSAKRFFTGTLLSRMTGMVREIAMAAAFGTVPAVAAFWMAFRFANLLRRMLAEGSFHAAFIPRFEAIRKNSPEEAMQFFHDVKKGLITLLTGIVVAAEVTLGSIYFFSIVSADSLEIIRLTMIMLPAIFFICLYGLNAAYLNCEKSYFIPSVAPTALNIVWIVAVFCVWTFETTTAITLLSLCIVVAFAAQWLMTVPEIHALTLSKTAAKNGLKAFFLLMKPLLLGMCGVAATQINSAVDTIFARLADSEGPAFLWYALRLQQLPLALFGVALTGALLPPISRAIQQHDLDQYFSFLHFSIKRSIAFMLPATLFFMATSLTMVNVVYAHGEFQHHATYEVSYCLIAYAVALLPMTLVLIMGASYYANQNWKIPTIMSLTTVALNGLFNSIAVFYLNLGAISVAIATSVAAIINCLLLMRYLKRDGRLVKSKAEGYGLLVYFLKIFMISFISYCAVKIANGVWFPGELPRTLTKQISYFTCESAIFASALLVQAKVFKIEEIVSLFPIKLWQKRTAE